MSAAVQIKLHQAALAGNIPAATEALADGADIDGLLPQIGRTGQIPLAQAIYGKQKEMLAFLLSRGADATRDARPGMPLLYCFIPMLQTPANNAIAIEMLTMLLDAGAVIDDVSDEEEHGQTLLGYCIERGGNMELVEFLVAKGADVNRMDLNGYTPLYKALHGKHYAIAAFLIDHGAAVTADGDAEVEPLAFAIVNQAPPDLVNKMLDAGAPVTPNTLEASLSLAANRAIFPLLAARPGFDINAPIFVQGGTLLHRCVAYHQEPEAVVRLISAGADVNRPNSVGNTPLMEAVRVQNIEILDLLLASGATASINYVSPARKTFALWIAASLPSTQILEHLLDAGADVNTKGGGDLTAIYAAVVNDNITHLWILMTAGADLSRYRSGTNGSTLLTTAAVRAGPAILRELITEGRLSPSGITREGTTPLSAAAKAKRLDNVLVLLELGADVNAKMPSSAAGAAGAASGGGGAGATKTIHDAAEAGEFTDAINRAILMPNTPWRGMSQADVAWFNALFDTSIDELSTAREKRPVAENTSVCPVCLGYVLRDAGCMIVSHDCREQTFYNAELYEMFHDAKGLVWWCTICGRICKEHDHHVLSVIGPGASGLATKPAVIPPPPGASFFAGDCKPLGGGGADEKLTRFRRLKEHAGELQSQIGKISDYAARCSLVAEMWNAPVKAPLSATAAQALRNAKNFGVSNALFTSTAAAAAVNADPDPLLDFRRPAGTTHPIEVFSVGAALGRSGGATATAENSIGFAGDGNVIYLRHTQLDGTLRDHLALQEGIGVEAFTAFVTDMTANFGGEDFGKCPWNGSGCKALLFPEEIAELMARSVVPGITPTIYARYRRAFNKRYAERKKVGRDGYTIAGTPYVHATAEPYRGAVAGAGLAGGGRGRTGGHRRAITRKHKNKSN